MLSMSKKTALGVVTLLSLVTFGCGDEKKTETPAAAAAPAYADIKAIMKTNCEGCHAQATISKDLSTEALLTASKAGVLTRIALARTDAKTMPPTSTYSAAAVWNTTADGVKLKAYLDALK